MFLKEFTVRERCISIRPYLACRASRFLSDEIRRRGSELLIRRLYLSTSTGLEILKNCERGLGSSNIALTLYYPANGPCFLLFFIFLELSQSAPPSPPTASCVFGATGEQVLCRFRGGFLPADGTRVFTEAVCSAG